MLALKEYDLLIAGGGFTGVAAALAAAREGRKVLIIEKNGFLGGAATNCLVNPFMSDSIELEDGTREKINTGIFSIILEGLAQKGALKGSTFHEEYLKVLFDELCEEAGVDVLFHTLITGAEQLNGRMTCIHAATKSGPFKGCAKYYLDCTGDADVCMLAGCSFQLGRESDQQCQPMTLCFRLSHVDPEKAGKNYQKMQQLYQRFQAEGKIKNPREDILTFHNIAEDVVHFNSTRIIKKNPTDPFDVSIAEREARKQVLELYQFLKENVEGYENSIIQMTAPEIGVRESRMIEGEYRITAEDIINCVHFEDSIARGCYFIDIHSPDGSGTERIFIPKGCYYTIPYRALIPKGMKNLLAAGRCISSTHEAQSAYRVIPIVCSIGEGAGTAIAVACQKNCDVSEVDIKEVHSLLDQYGAKY